MQKIKHSYLMRILDVVISFLVLSLTSPILIFASIGIILFSGKPILYKANRVGKGGKNFIMYKFRTMNIYKTDKSVITKPNDNRIFTFGRILRSTKIDELPQFINVIFGQMSIVGPRPEDPKMVEKYYTEKWMRETLKILPGITGPGSIYEYQNSEKLISREDPEETYAKKLLPYKLSLERDYILKKNIFNYLLYIILTIKSVISSQFK